jgi:hypothetical protein
LWSSEGNVFWTTAESDQSGKRKEREGGKKGVRERIPC